MAERASGAVVAAGANSRVGALILRRRVSGDLIRIIAFVLLRRGAAGSGRPSAVAVNRGGTYKSTEQMVEQVLAPLHCLVSVSRSRSTCDAITIATAGASGAAA